MSNYFILAILALTAVPIVLGVLLGLLRGSRRALLRLILIVVCIVVAVFVCGSVTNMVVEVDISGYVEGAEGTMTVTDYVAQMLGEDLQDLGDYVVPIIQSLVKIVLFLTIFFVLWFFSWLIIYPLCKLFVKPKKVLDSNGRMKKKKHRLLGGLFGLIQGVAVALCVCIVFNGLFFVGGQLMEISEGIQYINENTSEGEPSTYAEEGDSTEEGSGSIFGDIDFKAWLEEYKSSSIAQIYDKVGSKPFAWLTKVETKDGRTVTLSGQMEALDGIVDIACEFIKISDLDFDNLYVEGNITTITEILNNIQSIKEGLSEEANNTVEGILDVLGKSFGIDIKRFYGINFATEAEAFSKLSEYKDKDFSKMTAEEIKNAAVDIVNSVGKSELLMDILEEQDIDVGNGLSDAQIDEINNVLDEMIENKELDEEVANRLREIFGLTYSD